MKYFLKKVQVSNRESLLRTLAFATAGSGLMWFGSDETSKRAVSVSISTPLRDSLLRRWQIIHFLPTYVSANPAKSEDFPAIFSRAVPVPSADVDKEDSRPVTNGSKPCCGCLGRDSIATAAAQVGPAVVNLSVPQGFHGMTLGKSIGSGTIIDPDGTILTCAHVVVDFQGLKASSKGKRTRSSEIHS